jgi:hypothetical protein
VSLYPTRTRRELLAAVANGQVITDYTADCFVAVLFPDAPTSWQDRVTVTARVREAEQAGWIKEQGTDWRLTEAGWDALGRAS